MSAFSSASKALFKTLRDAAGVKVTYTRRGGNSFTLTAVRGQTQFQQQADTPGEVVFLHSYDFIFNAKDLIESGSYYTPGRGDTVTDLDGVVYTVLTDGTDAMYKYTDQSKETIRVHCKRVS